MAINGIMLLESEIIKQLKKNKLYKKYNYKMKWIKGEEYNKDYVYLRLILTDTIKDKVVQTYDIPEYKLNDIDSIFNHKVYVKAIISYIKEYEENKKRGN